MSEGTPTGWEGADRFFADPAGGPPGGPSEPPAGGEDDEAAPPPAPRCEVCGAELEPDQTYCLECGSPTPLAPRLRRRGRPLLILAGGLAILGLGAGALAYAVASDDGEGTAGTGTLTFTATGPVVPLPPETAPTTGGLPPDPSFTTPTFPTTPTSPTTGFPTETGPGPIPPAPTTDVVPPEPEPEPGPAPDPDPGLDPDPDPGPGASDWPPGRTAWTAVLSSVRDEGDARAAKTRVQGAGDEAGVLFSSDFPDLRPGYWVVFSGTYDDRTAAVSQATRMRGRFPGAYARRVSG